MDVMERTGRSERERKRERCCGGNGGILDGGEEMKEEALQRVQ